MGRARDFTEDAGLVLIAFLAYKAYRTVKDATSPKEWLPDLPDLPDLPTIDPAPRYPGEPGYVDPTVWSEATMRLFVDHMYSAGIDARLVLLGIAASSDFQPDESLGENTGLLMVQRSDLVAVGYDDDARPFEGLKAPEQIPWIGRVLSYLIASRGGAPPTTIADLALLVHPTSSAVMAAVIRNQAERMAERARQSERFARQDVLLQKVLLDHSVRPV